MLFRSHLRHVVLHLDPKLLDVGVQVEVGILHLWRDETLASETLQHSSLQPPGGAPHQPADLLLSVGGRASCGFDHGGGLIICQLLDAPLPCYYVTHLKRDTHTGDPVLR